MSYIGEPIEALFDEPPVLEKMPGCPDAIVWRGRTHRIAEMLSVRHDYVRRGRMSLNMQPEHAAVAARRGSWGVGRDYYRVRLEDGRCFELYYDRKPKSATDRKGGWYLYRRLSEDGADSR